MNKNGNLVLSRRAGQKIIIGDDITLKVISHDEKSVKFAFDAPKSTRIDREEIRIKKDDNKSGAL